MILCWFYKREICRKLDANEPLPERVEKHLRRCASCELFHERQVQVAEQLIASAPRLLKAPSPFLHGKIMAAIERGPRQAGVEQLTPRPVWPVAIAALGLVLLFGAMFYNWQAPVTTMDSTNVAAVREPTHSSFTGFEALSSVARVPDARKLREWSQNLDQPLETELQSVVYDARQALQLLAHSFLPEQVRESLQQKDTEN